MHQCGSIKANGERCQAVAMAQSDWCVSHDPDRKEARRRAASKAARSKPNPEIRALRKQAASLYEDVLVGAVEPGVAAVACQVANLQARLVELERKIREADEFEGRIAELEERARWRA